MHTANPINGCVSEKMFTLDYLNGADILAIAPNDSATWISIPAGKKMELSSVSLSLGVYPVSGENCSKEKFAFPPIHTFKITYINQLGIAKDVNISCNGLPPTPVSLPI